MLTLTFYSDPGHGWLEVDRDLLVDLGIADEVSSYSYQRGDKVFLEEDCDFSRFASAMKAAGREFKTIEVNEPRSDSWVRLLPSYEPDMIEPDMVSDEARSYGPQGRAA